MTKNSKTTKFKNRGHNKCAYCGGTRKTDSRDHVPPIAFFTDKNRPMGLETPACNRCHRSFNKIDSIASLISKLAFGNEYRDKSTEPLHNLISNLTRYFPDLVPELIYQMEEIYFSTNGIIRPAFCFNKLPTELENILNFFSARVVSALYYHTAKKPLAIGSQITITIISRIAYGKSNFSQSLAHSLPNYGYLKQGRLDTSRQFSYKYSFDSSRYEFITMINFKNMLFAHSCVTREEEQTPAASFIVTKSGILPSNNEMYKSWKERGILK